MDRGWNQAVVRSPHTGAIKVVRVIARLNIGGPARHAVILNDGLSARGFDTLLVHGSVDPDEGTLQPLVRQRGLRAVVIPELGRSVRPGADFRALLRVTRLLFQERPDVVHTHTAKAGTLGRLAALIFNLTRSRRRRCVVVHTFHGHVLEGYFGPAGNLAVRIAERLLAMLTDRIVTISPMQRRDIVERFRIAAREMVDVVPLGLDLDALITLPDRRSEARGRFGLGPDDVVVGYVGRFVPIKDLDTLIQAFAAAARRESRLRLLMIGDGERRSHLEALAASLGIQVQFAGWQLDLPLVYSAMDVVVLSSRNEGTPVALIEAMAAGRAVAATAVGGVPDLIEDGRTGILVPARDAQRLADAILTLARDASLRERLGSAARRDVRTRFAAERLVSDIDALYTVSLRQKRRVPATRNDVAARSG
jgi:glycosyltransferase involved in cell wall biosynthesis